jgi:PKD repeat protein
LIHPIGNESFPTGETMKIRWTTPSVDSTASINLAYSEDGGLNWTAIGKTTLTRTFFDWKLPAKNTAKAKIRIEYGNQKIESPKIFNVIAAPKNLKISKVCPDSATFTWDLAAGATRYTLLQLGNRYMDSVATFSGGKGQIKIGKAFFTEENWFSVRSADSLGLRGRRINAITYKGALLNCPQSQDVSLTQNQRPLKQYDSQCGTLTDSVVVSVKNVGLEYISDVKVFYQFGDNTVVEKTLPDTISPLSSLTYVFPEKIIFDGVDKKTLKVWTSLTGDKFLYNDTLSKVIAYNCLKTSSLAVDYPHSQNFENLTKSYPNAWSVSNPDLGATIGLFETIGASGTKSQVMAMDFTASNTGQKDELFSVPIKIPADLTATPYLLFDLAYGSFDVTNTSSDRLKVWAYDNCEHLNGQELYSKGGTEFSTTNTNNGQWLPSRANQWRTEVIDVSAWKGKEIILGFQGTSQRKSIMYLDNIRFGTFNPITADANIFGVNTNVCSKSSLSFSAKADPTFTYLWSFGTSAVPSTAVGSGPINVVFGQPSGQNTVQLIVKTQNTVDTASKIIEILKLATVNFTFVKNGLELTLTNKSLDATSYLWEFGDGTSATEENPIHVFPKNGTYNITLTASNDCGKIVAKKPVSVAASTAVDDLFDAAQASISPNPNNGNFDLIIDNQSLSELEYTLTDVLGKIILKKKTTVSLGKNTIPIEPKTLSKGLYFLQLNAQDKQTTLKVVVE